MSSTPKISLSLLDLLFCAFGGVIVMAVLFISIAGEPSGPPPKKSAHLEFCLMYQGEKLDSITFQVMPDSMNAIFPYQVVKDTFINNGLFSLYTYSDSYANSNRNLGRISVTDFFGDTVKLKAQVLYAGDRHIEDGVEFRIARFQDGYWDTISKPFGPAFRPGSYSRDNCIPINIELR